VAGESWASATAAGTSTAPPGAAGISAFSRWSGSSRYAGPCRCVATEMARRNWGTSRSGWSTRAAHRVSGATTASWSSSWNAPLPRRSTAVPADSTSTGAADDDASSTPVSELVTAGPLPITTTPSPPDCSAYPVAMNTALRWSLHSTNRIPAPATAPSASMSSPGSPNRTVTPASRSTSAAARHAPVVMTPSAGAR
jgi:hypothetical protein